MKTRGRWLGGALVTVLSVGCGSEEGVVPATGTRPSATVQVVKAQLRDLTRRVTYTGAIEPVRVARMASPAEGPIVACPVREGDRVTAGQRLVRLGRSHSAESGLEAAREELRRQEAESRRIEQLVTHGALPGEQLEISRAALKRAEAQVAAAETGAGDYEISAPWNGVISRVWVAEGNDVAPRTPLV